tara:strand:+ start:106 stop:309 length:204 start_codon:yes stop_codon:yes gene_type:complete
MLVTKVNQKNMKVKPVEELRQYVIESIRSADDLSFICKAYETVSGNIVTDEAVVENSTEDFVYVYEH